MEAFELLFGLCLIALGVCLARRYIINPIREEGAMRAYLAVEEAHRYYWHAWRRDAKRTWPVTPSRRDMPVAGANGVAEPPPMTFDLASLKQYQREYIDFYRQKFNVWRSDKIGDATCLRLAEGAARDKFKGILSDEEIDDLNAYISEELLSAESADVGIAPRQP